MTYNIEKILDNYGSDTRGDAAREELNNLLNQIEYLKIEVDFLKSEVEKYKESTERLQQIVDSYNDEAYERNTYD